MVIILLFCGIYLTCFSQNVQANLHRNRMGRNSSNHSESPVGRRGSPHRESPSNRERSPVRHKTSRRGSSPVRERSPSRRRSSRRDNSLEREKRSGHTKSPKHASSQSPISCSPSPRTKRLRRAQAEKEVEKVKEREYERNHSRGSEKSTHRDRASGKERNSEREMGVDRKERKSGRDDTNSKSARGRHDRSVSPSNRHHRSRHRSRSPASNSRARDEVNNSRGAEQRDDEYDSVSKMKAAEEALEAKQKVSQKPTFELSGKLAAETNRVRGVTLLFNEPPDARKPDIRWRLYVFKAGEVLNEPLYIHRQSCYLFGRERRVADIPTDHPSCSKQHAVIQFRQVEKEQPDGTLSKQVRPYIMDLGSTNKTFINDNPIEPQRYYELFEKDTIKFGNSSREYVLLHENSSQ
ncbi:Forkhead-associated (FHA) domain - like 10 [Theobroma cacao]|nr:Forkhead-associated (FHA) domain - like 10 [Theobroma cacao]